MMRGRKNNALDVWHLYVMASQREGQVGMFYGGQRLHYPTHHSGIYLIVSSFKVQSSSY